MKHTADRAAPGAPLTARQVAELVGGRLEGAAGGDGAACLRRVHALTSAGPEDVAWFRAGADDAGRRPRARELRALEASRAGLLLLDGAADAGGRPCVRVDDPSLAAARLARYFTGAPHRPPAGVHFAAVVDPEATVAAGAAVGPGCVVAAGAAVEEDAVLVAQVCVGAGSRVGARCRLEPGVVLGERVTLGAGCWVQANAVIGSDGFGYVWDGERHLKVPQTGGVRVGDGVEIGAGTCIDAGTYEPTVIGDGCILDNQVQVGHNCRIGRFVVLCGQVGISGSAEIGDGAVFAGQAGAAGHLRVGAGARVAAKAAVMGDVPDGATVAGQPATDLRLHQRATAMLRRMARRREDAEGAAD